MCKWATGSQLLSCSLTCWCREPLEHLLRGGRLMIQPRDGSAPDIVDAQANASSTEWELWSLRISVLGLHFSPWVFMDWFRKENIAKAARESPEIAWVSSKLTGILLDILISFVIFLLLVKNQNVLRAFISVQPNMPLIFSYKSACGEYLSTYAFTQLVLIAKLNREVCALILNRWRKGNG